MAGSSTNLDAPAVIACHDGGAAVGEPVLVSTNRAAATLRRPLENGPMTGSALGIR